MRNAFAATITELAEQDDRVVLLSGDIGNNLFNTLRQNCPKQFFNCGVAEANMTGVAAGLAMTGMRPVTYTITPFNTTRCLEQIRVDICYQNLPVVVVGTGAGLSYAGLGGTHHSCEDIAFLRAIPNMQVLCPADAVEVKLAVKAAITSNKPTYIRIGKKNEPIIHAQPPQFTIGKAIKVKEGGDICLLSTGNTLPLAMEVADSLAALDISTEVYSFHTVKPLDNAALEQVFSRFKLIATVEEHSIIGGFGAAVAEWKAETGMGSTLIRFGTPDQFIHGSGSQNNARRIAGLTNEAITECLLKSFRET